MNLKTFDTVLQRATHFGLALVMTLGMLGSIDRLAQEPQLELLPMAQQAEPAQG
jgi:hypothetical protein